MSGHSKWRDLPAVKRIAARMARERQTLEELAKDAPGPIQRIIDADGNVRDYRSVYDPEDEGGDMSRS